MRHRAAANQTVSLRGRSSTERRERATHIRRVRHAIGDLTSRSLDITFIATYGILTNTDILTAPLLQLLERGALTPQEILLEK